MTESIRSDRPSNEEIASTIFWNSDEALGSNKMVQHYLDRPDIYIPVDNNPHLVSIVLERNSRTTRNSINVVLLFNDGISADSIGIKYNVNKSTSTCSYIGNVFIGTEMRNGILGPQPQIVRYRNNDKNISAAMLLEYNQNSDAYSEEELIHLSNQYETTEETLDVLEDEIALRLINDILESMNTSGYSFISEIVSNANLQDQLAMMSLQELKQMILSSCQIIRMATRDLKLDNISLQQIVSLHNTVELNIPKLADAYRTYVIERLKMGHDLEEIRSANVEMYIGSSRVDQLLASVEI